MLFLLKTKRTGGYTIFRKPKIEYSSYSIFYSKKTKTLSLLKKGIENILKSMNFYEHFNILIMEVLFVLPGQLRTKI